MKRDREQCVMCGKQASKYPIHPYDFLDVSHIFSKSVWPLVRFHMLNVKILCRKCHEWWGSHPNEADSWIRQYLRQRKYAELLNAVMYPDPLFRDLSKVEVYLKQQIRRYS
jgi:hypothetical protein